MVAETRRRNSEELVKFYIGYRLRKSGHNDWSSSENGHSLIKHKRTLQLLGDQFEQAYYQVFDDMTSAINVHSPNLKEDYLDILNKTFDDKIVWGRVIGIFVLASKVAIKALDCNKSDTVVDVMGWTADFFTNSRVGAWIDTQGGWDNMVEFFSKASPGDLGDSWKQACSFGLNVLNGAANILSYLQRT